MVPSEKLLNKIPYIEGTPEFWNGDFELLRLLPITRSSTGKNIFEAYSRERNVPLKMLPYFLSHTLPPDWYGTKIFLLGTPLQEANRKNAPTYVWGIDTSVAPNKKIKLRDTDCNHFVSHVVVFRR